MPCHIEKKEVSISDTSGKLIRILDSRFKKLTCPWLTVTAVEFEKNRSRTLLISVNQNETEKKREAYINFGHNSGFTITQSAD
jgi:hypothetical protein